jgi:hypothetical protein
MGALGDIGAAAGMLAPLAVLALVVVLGHALTQRRDRRPSSGRRGAAQQPDAPVPEPPRPDDRRIGPHDDASITRRLVGSLVNTALVVALLVGAVRGLDLRIPVALVAAPLAVHLLSALVGLGPGELLAGTRIVDATAGGRLTLLRVAVRTLAQLVTTAVAAMVGFTGGLVGSSLVMTAIGHRNLEVMLVIGFVTAPVLVALAEPWLVLASGDRHATLWDIAASSTVVRRRRPTAPVDHEHGDGDDELRHRGLRSLVRHRGEVHGEASDHGG